MRLSNVKRISKEDLANKSKDEPLPQWLDPMLETLNTFIEQVTNAVNGNLAFDNLLGKEVYLDFTTGIEQLISPDLDGRAQLRAYAVFLADTNGANATGFKWRVLTNGKLGVTVTLTGATTAKCRLLIYLR